MAFDETSDQATDQETPSTVPPPITNPWTLFLAVSHYVKRVLLHGVTPGTGKTTAGLALADAKQAESISITLTDGMMATDLLGTLLPSGPGQVKWHDGPVASAIRRAMHGLPTVLIMNEIDHAGPDAAHICYAVLEASGKSGSFTLSTGEVLSVTDNLIVVATMNPDPADVLPEPVLNRFQVVIDVGPHVSPMILEALPPHFRSMVADGRMAAREAFALISLTGAGCDPFVAVQAVLGTERMADFGDALAISLAS